MKTKLLTIFLCLIACTDVFSQGRLIYKGQYTSSDITTVFCMGNATKYNSTPMLWNISIYENTLYCGSDKAYPFMGTKVVNGYTTRVYGNNAWHYVVFSDNSLYHEYVSNIMGMETVSQTVYLKGNFLQGNNYGNNYGNNGNAYQQPQNSNSQKRQVTCSLCNGWGKYLIDYAPRYSGSKPDQWCEQCRKNDYVHTHRTCASCQGKGVVTR